MRAMPESLQGSDQGQKGDAAADALAEAVASIEEALESLDTQLNNASTLTHVNAVAS